MNEYKITLTDRDGVEVRNQITLTAEQRPEIIIIDELVFKHVRVDGLLAHTYALSHNVVRL